MTDLLEVAHSLRYYCLACSTKAGSGHPTSSLSAADLMAVLFFNGHLHYDVKNPSNPGNDHVIFSKGHASPLYYSLWMLAGGISEKELMTYRRFGSRLEGHPTMRFPFADAATGSLGQGLGIGVGIALNSTYLDHSPVKTYVLLGDSEMAEGSVWESMAIASYYNLSNLIAIVDVNRLGQRGETMHGHTLSAYQKKAKAFGWKTLVINGHNIRQIDRALGTARKSTKQPVMILAKTLKGKGITFLENKEGWHGKTLLPEQFDSAARELGLIAKTPDVMLSKPHAFKPKAYSPKKFKPTPYIVGESFATRKAYGSGLCRIQKNFPGLVVLDAEVSNSTYSAVFGKHDPSRFFEMFIAEQNMIEAGVGLSKMGKIPFISTFAAFLSRGFDQIRMAAYSEANLKICGSHAGVSIGQDGSSQMGLEDISMMRSIYGSTVFYPSDAVSTEKLVEVMAGTKGISYIRTTRPDLPVIYKDNENFMVGGSKILKKSSYDQTTLIGAGITLHESLKAYDLLKEKGIFARVVDLYSIKPLDEKTLVKCAKETGFLVISEDHYSSGGIGEAVRSALDGAGCQIVSLFVSKMPKSGTKEELLSYEGIDAQSIVGAVLSHIKSIGKLRSKGNKR